MLHREFVYIWHYFEVQLRQVFPYWVLGAFATGLLVNLLV